MEVHLHYPSDRDCIRSLGVSAVSWGSPIQQHQHSTGNSDRPNIGAGRSKSLCGREHIHTLTVRSRPCLYAKQHYITYLQGGFTTVEVRGTSRASCNERSSGLGVVSAQSGGLPSLLGVTTLPSLDLEPNHAHWHLSVILPHKPRLHARSMRSALEHLWWHCKS